MQPQIGRHTYITEKTPIIGQGRSDSIVRIGNFSSIGPGIKFILIGHPTHTISTFPFPATQWARFLHPYHPTSKGDIVIGNDVWVGARATIVSGVTVGDGAVIAAASHVVKDVPPYAIVGGNPATLIRYRFTPEQINALLDIKWWEWSDEVIQERLPLITSPNVDDFIIKFHKH